MDWGLRSPQTADPRFTGFESPVNFWVRPGPLAPGRGSDYSYPYEHNLILIGNTIFRLWYRMDTQNWPGPEPGLNDVNHDVAGGICVKINGFAYSIFT
jgi:hypothetical protein